MRRIALPTHPVAMALEEIEAVLDKHGVAVVIYPGGGLALHDVKNDKYWRLADPDTFLMSQKIPRDFDGEVLYRYVEAEIGE